MIKMVYNDAAQWAREVLKVKKIIIHGPQVSKVKIFEALRLYFIIRLLYCVIMDKIEHTDTCGFEYMAIQSEQVTVDTWGFE